MNLQPWFTPDDSVEALEILSDTAEFLRNTAHFSPMRKELRKNLEARAASIEEFSMRTKKPIVDPGLMLALDTMAREKHKDVNRLIMEALEVYISTYNRRK